MSGGPMREDSGALLCSGCEQALAEHCETCAWLICANDECGHRTYDLERGILATATGVEVLGI